MAHHFFRGLYAKKSEIFRSVRTESVYLRLVWYYARLLLYLMRRMSFARPDLRAEKNLKFDMFNVFTRTAFIDDHLIPNARNGIGAKLFT